LMHVDIFQIDSRYPTLCKLKEDLDGMFYDPLPPSQKSQSLLQPLQL